MSARSRSAAVITRHAGPAAAPGAHQRPLVPGAASARTAAVKHGRSRRSLALLLLLLAGASPPLSEPLAQWLPQLAGAGSAHAEARALPMPQDSRLVTFRYDPDDVYAVYLQPGLATAVVTGHGEEIQSVVLGDTVLWNVEVLDTHRHVYVKPVRENLYTSMSIVTTGRMYNLLLISGQPGAVWYQRVTWEDDRSVAWQRRGVPDVTTQARPAHATAPPVQAAAQPTQTMLDPARLNFNYEINGQAPFKPLHVFDDGANVWIALPPEAPLLPALFYIEDNQASVADYVHERGYLRTTRLFNHAELRVNRERVMIRRRT